MTEKKVGNKIRVKCNEIEIEVESKDESLAKVFRVAHEIAVSVFGGKLYSRKPEERLKSVGIG